MQNSSINAFIDYFKLFKVFQLKKIEKTGIVKIVQDKQLSRKIISVEGNISTSNFITFQANNFPNIGFSERYLYIQGFVDAGKSFCFQVSYTLGTKLFKAVYSTLYKSPKKHLENIVHLPMSLPTNKWTIAVVDLYELGLHFGFKPQEMKMIFKVSSIEIRASSKVKGLFQSDHMYSIDKLPKDICFPLKKEENFFEKYHYFVETTDPACLKYATQFKQVIQQEMQKDKAILEERKQKEKLKESKSIQKKKPLSSSKSRKSLQKNQEKESDKIDSKQTKNIHNKKAQNNSSVRPPIGRKKEEKQNQSKVVAKQQQQMQDCQMQSQQVPPAPQGIISLNLSCVEGFSVNSGNLMAVESYLYKPVYMPVHKPIQLLASCDDHNMRVVTAYNDGSICVWDAIRKTPLGYYLTELQEIKIIITDVKFNLILIGLDKMKRQVINIISDGSVIFRQISNFNISGAILASKQSFEFGIITYGFENIRLWRINNEKSIIQGSNVYLGQTSRKVRYTSAIVVQTREDFIAYVTDNNGFITIISVVEGKMLQSMKIDSKSIDLIMLLRDGRCIIANQAGVIKVMSLQRMEVLEEFSLQNRIKDMKELPSDEIILTHYNKSIGSLNLQSSMYCFLMRSHTAPITKISFNAHFSKVISISKDSSIRIWQYVSDHQGPFQFRLQEQYQFLITGEEMVDVACASQGKVEDVNKVIVGGDSGKIRVINIEKYVIQQEVMIEAGEMSLSISRNGKYVLCTYSSGNSYLLDSSLTILFKYLMSESSRKKMKCWKNGFNTISKQYYVENVQDQTLEFYALKEQKTPIFTINYSEKSSQISFIGTKVYIANQNELKMFEKGNLMQIFNLNISILKNTADKCTAFEFPLLCLAIGPKIMMKVVTDHLEQERDLPEAVNNIEIEYDQEKQEGLIICSGKHSYSLYVFTYQLHNISQDITSLMPSRYEQQNEENNQNELQISFSNKTTVSAYLQKRQASIHPNNREGSRILEPPKELRSLYAQEQALYEQVKQYVFPKSFQQPIETPQEDDQPYQQKQEDVTSNELGVLLNYGYQLRQSSREDHEIGDFFWLSDNNSLILVTGCNRSIMQHFFSVPIKHKIINFPSPITALCMAQRSSEGLRYLAVCINAHIKLYNVAQEMGFIRGIDVISKALMGAVIFQSCITNCNRYMVTLSYNDITFDGKLYIHVIELSSGSVVSSSYLSLPLPKNKYKNNQIKEAKEYKMLVNPLKTGLEFVVFNPQGILYFYRITSIFTLQTLQLEELVPLCRDKTTAISCGCFIGVGQSALEDAVLALGSENGSLVFIDCRTGSIMIACIGVIPSPILGIAYSKQHDQQYDKLILFSNSTLMTVFNLTQGLNSILNAMDDPSKSTTNQLKRVMTLDGEVTSQSNVQSNGQQIVITKTGSLWLLDYEDFVTVKVSSVHTLPINQAEVLMGGKEDAYLLTSSDDGCVKLSNVVNLEQALEIYKPRKQAKCFSTSGSYFLVSFSDEVYIYNKISPDSIDQECQLSSLGSFRLESTVVAMANIPSTENYYILTEKEALIVYVALRQAKSTKSVSIRASQVSQLSSIRGEVGVQIQKITDIQLPVSVIVNAEYAPYDQFSIVFRAGKVTVWTRKCLKRTYNPIDELANVHELSYYLIDAHSRTTADSTYVRFMSESEYLWGLLQEGLVQVRNFRDHSVTRQIRLSVDKLSTMTCSGELPLLFWAGDHNGYLYILSENGLLLDKVKALECSMKGIHIWQAGKSKRLLVYGSKYAATLAVSDLH